MAKVRIKASKEDVEQSEDRGDYTPAPVGVYLMELVSIEPRYAKGDNDKPDKNRPYLNVAWKPEKVFTKAGELEDLPEQYGWVFDVVSFSSESGWKRAQFGRALGLKVRNGEIDDEIEIEEGKPGTVLGKKAKVRLKKDKDQDGDYRPKVGALMPLDAGALPDDPMGDDGDGAGDDSPFGDTGDGDDELWTEESLGELELKELGAEAKENWDLTPQDYIVKVRGKVNNDKTKAALIAAILEAQGAEGEGGEGDDDGDPDDPF